MTALYILEREYISATQYGDTEAAEALRRRIIEAGGTVPTEFHNPNEE